MSNVLIKSIKLTLECPLMTGWVGVKCPDKKHYVTLEWPLMMGWVGVKCPDKKH